MLGSGMLSVRIFISVLLPGHQSVSSVAGCRTLLAWCWLPLQSYPVRHSNRHRLDRTGMSYNIPSSTAVDPWSAQVFAALHFFLRILVGLMEHTQASQSRPHVVSICSMHRTDYSDRAYPARTLLTMISSWSRLLSLLVHPAVQEAAEESEPLRSGAYRLWRSACKTLCRACPLVDSTGTGALPQVCACCDALIRLFMHCDSHPCNAHAVDLTQVYKCI